jgi:CheY-like chemotaxis protein
MEIKGKILIIDDDRDVLDLLEYNLVKEGFTICCLENPAEAIPIGLMFQPDLIILDIMMPPLMVSRCAGNFVQFLFSKKYQFSFLQRLAMPCTQMKLSVLVLTTSFIKCWDCVHW